MRQSAEMPTRFLKSLLLFTLLGFGLTACLPPKQDIPEPQAGSADFSRTVALGGSIMAGYANGALRAEEHAYSLPALIAGQMEAAGGGAFNQPLVPEGDGIGLNVKPWEGEYQSGSQLGTRVDCNGEESLGPVKRLLSGGEAGNYLTPQGGASFHNFAVPYASVADWNSPNFTVPFAAGTVNPFPARFLSDPVNGTLLGDALAANPTFFVLWPGMQEIFDYAASGGTRPAPNANDFASELGQALASLNSAGAKGVLATIPYIENFPFFATIPARGLNLSQGSADSLNEFYALGGFNIGFQAGENGFIIADTTHPDGIRQMTANEFITLTVPLDSMKCYLLGVLFTEMPDQYTLMEAEISQINALVDAYNQQIEDLAANFNLPVVDLHGFYNRLNSGIVVDAMDFNTNFVTGNFFSLDGYTPSPKGAGLLANEYISAINDFYGASLPPVRIDVLEGLRFP